MEKKRPKEKTQRAPVYPPTPSRAKFKGRARAVVGRDIVGGGERARERRWGDATALAGVGARGR